MLLVLFTFNVTETENTTQQPFITKPWEIGGHASLSLSFSSLSVYLLHSFSLYPSINSPPFSTERMHCLKFTHGTQRLPLPNPPLLSVSILHHNSLKGGISKSTNGRDLIGKCYKGRWGCLLSALAAGGETPPWWSLEWMDGVTLQNRLTEKCRCFAWRWANREDELLYIWNGAEEEAETTKHSKCLHHHQTFYWIP